MLERRQTRSMVATSSKPYSSPPRQSKPKPKPTPKATITPKLSKKASGDNESDRFACGDCGTRLSSETAVENHLYNIHGKASAERQCGLDGCSHITYTSYAMNNHQFREHPEFFYDCRFRTRKLGDKKCVFKGAKNRHQAEKHLKRDHPECTFEQAIVPPTKTLPQGGERIHPISPEKAAAILAAFAANGNNHCDPKADSEQQGGEKRSRTVRTRTRRSRSRAISSLPSSESPADSPSTLPSSLSSPGPLTPPPPGPAPQTAAPQQPDVQVQNLGAQWFAEEPTSALPPLGTAMETGPLVPSYAPDSPHLFSYTKPLPFGIITSFECAPVDVTDEEAADLAAQMPGIVEGIANPPTNPLADFPEVQFPSPYPTSFPSTSFNNNHAAHFQPAIDKDAFMASWNAQRFQAGSPLDPGTLQGMTVAPHDQFEEQQASFSSYEAPVQAQLYPSTGYVWSSNPLPEQYWY